MESSKLNFKIDNHPTQQSLAEMELWNPPQGSINECFPIQLDVAFDRETFQTRRSEIEVFLKGAELLLILEDCEVVRGSKIGDELVDPYDVAEVTASAKEQLEEYDEVSAGLEFSISKTFFGNIIASLKKNIGKRKLKIIIG